MEISNNEIDGYTLSAIINYGNIELSSVRSIVDCEWGGVTDSAIFESINRVTDMILILKDGLKQQ